MSSQLSILKGKIYEEGIKVGEKTEKPEIA